MASRTSPEDEALGQDLEGKRQEAELEVAQIKTLSLSLGATGMDWIRSDDIRGTAARVRCCWR